MQTLDDETTQALRDMDRAKKELADSLRGLERLKVERSAAEKLANEAQRGMVRDRGRDWELERTCARHTSMLEHLYEALALRSLHAPHENELEVVFGQNEGSCTVRLTMDEPGGQVEHYEVLDAHNEPLPLSNEAEAYVKAAIVSNAPSMVVQGIWQELQ